jgi:hypothetical protein
MGTEPTEHEVPLADAAPPQCHIKKNRAVGTAPTGHELPPADVTPPPCPKPSSVASP